MTRKPQTKTDGNLTHDNTKNALTDDEVKALTFQHKKRYQAALAAKKAAAAEFLNVTKLAKAELGDHAVKDIKDLVAIEENENAETDAKVEIERKMRIYRWAGLPIGHQTDMFTPDLRPIAEKAYEEGKNAGLNGEVCQPPHGGGTEAYHEYVRGWHDGQAALASLIKKKDAAEAPLIVTPTDDDGSGDDFDDAADGVEAAEASDGGDWPDDRDVEANAEEREPAEVL